MKRYYFIDDEIYFKNVKQPPRKVELFFVDKVGSLYLGKDEDGNDYVIGEEDMIIEEE
jgi:hypothetical protein